MNIDNARHRPRAATGKRNTRARLYFGASVISAFIVGAVLPMAPITADAKQEEPRPSIPAHGSGPAVYIQDGRVVAIRRDPVPPGEYGGQGVDYSPHMAAYFLDGPCAK
jgi:hypothetical protein